MNSIKFDRGIEHRKIFYDNTDRDNFLELLWSVLTETSTPCFGMKGDERELADGDLVETELKKVKVIMGTPMFLYFLRYPRYKGRTSDLRLMKSELFDTWMACLEKPV